MKILFLIIFFLNVLFARTFTETGRIDGQGKPFSHPQAIALSVGGTLYVVDSGNNRIQIFDKRGQFLRTIGGFGFEADQFDYPVDIWMRSLINIYISDYNNRRVQRYDRRLNFISSLISNEADNPDVQFEEVLSCALNSNNDLFILEHSENKIVKINRRGEKERSFGTYESGEGELEEPQQLDIADNRFLLVSDAGAKAVFIFDFFGNFIRKIVSPQFVHPAGLCVLEDGSFLLADSEANRLFLINPDFSEVSAISLKTSRPLRRLRDATIIKTDKGALLYLIDGDQVLIGYLR